MVLSVYWKEVLRDSVITVRIPQDRTHSYYPKKMVYNYLENGIKCKILNLRYSIQFEL